jgi:hypothetical protein
MSDTDSNAAGRELLLADPEIVAWLGEQRRPDPDEAEDDPYEPPRAA